MKCVVILVVLAALVCTSCGSPTDGNTVILRQRRDLQILGNTQKLIQELVANLQKAGQQAVEAVNKFTAGLEEQAKLFKEKVVKDLEKLKEKVSEAIQNLLDKISSSGAAVKECVNSHRQDADVLFNDTLSKITTCADNRINEIREQMEALSTLSSKALEFGNNALDEMKNCTEKHNGSFLSTASCLGTVAVKTELKGAVYVTQIGISISRINLALATLPASLEVCAGARLVEAGMGTAKILVEIGSCSTSSVISNFTAQSMEPIEFNKLHDIVSQKDIDGLKNLFLLRVAKERTVWSSIKDSIIKAWESIKNISKYTKEKIASWVLHLKEHAKDVIETFKNQIKNIKEKAHEIIENALGTGEIIKKCIKSESKDIEEILQQILQHVTNCIKENTNKVSLLETQNTNVARLYEDDIYEEIEEKLSACVNDPDGFETCLKNIFDEIEITEGKILKTNLQARSIINDILQSIALCSLDGIVDASDAIANETLHIIECVKKNKP